MAEKTLEEMREAVDAIREKMAAAAREAGRAPAEVQLCAAQQTQTHNEITLCFIQHPVPPRPMA